MYKTEFEHENNTNYLVIMPDAGGEHNDYQQKMISRNTFSTIKFCIISFKFTWNTFFITWFIIVIIWIIIIRIRLKKSQATPLSLIWVNSCNTFDIFPLSHSFSKDFKLAFLYCNIFWIWLWDEAISSMNTVTVSCEMQEFNDFL